MQRISLTILLAFFVNTTLAQSVDERKACIFRATFDVSADAELAEGDSRIFTADSLKRAHVQPGIQTDSVKWLNHGGVAGGALEFKAKTPQLIFFKGGKNLPYRENAFAGTVSLWMKLDPQRDLPKGYVDPLQITDKKWNDSSFFIDFDQGAARDFRLGVFSDYKTWNPTDRKYDDIPAAERPLVTVQKPPFTRERWTHVAFTWNKFNTGQPTQSSLFLNGTLQGSVAGQQQFTWDVSKAVIMLGINYVGLMDEVAIYNRALTVAEITEIATSHEAAVK